MAIRKAKIAAQFQQAIQPSLEPGEQYRVGTLAQSGPTPWLQGALGILMMMFFGMRYYFIAVTDRRVLFFRGSLMTVRPKAFEWSDPLGSGRLLDVNADATLWSHFKYTRPAETKATRFNVHRIWRAELQEVLSAVTGSAAAPPMPTG
jgi:hypothetical protein